MKKTATIIFAFLTLITMRTLGQPAGSPDLSFNSNGKVVYNKDNHDLYQDVKIQPDGKIIATGTFLTPTWSSGIEVTRYLENGSFDPSFGTDGHYNYAVNTENGAYKCMIGEDGKILICGYTTDYTVWSLLLIRLMPDGTPDPSFGSNGIVIQDLGPGEDIAYAMALQDDGKILLAGYSQNSEFKNVPLIVRFTDAGILDSSFGTGGVAAITVTETDNDFSAIAIQSDGKILAAGHISNGLSWFSLLIARFDAAGQPDPAYGTGGVVNLNLGNVDDEFYDLQLTPDDEAVAAGFTVSQGDLRYHLLLMKFDASGTPVPSFGTGGSVIWGEVPYTFGDAMVMQSDGKILVAGCTGALMPDNNDWAIWRFNNDGSPDPDFGTNGLVTTEFFGKADEALGIALYQDKIVVAGKTRNANDLLDFAVARYLNDVGVAVKGNEQDEVISISPNPARPGQMVQIATSFKQPGVACCEILDLSGKRLMQQSLEIHNTANQSIEIKLPAELAAGLYFLRISGQPGSPVTRKLIIQ